MWHSGANAIIHVGAQKSRLGQHETLAQPFVDIPRAAHTAISFRTLNENEMYKLVSTVPMLREWCDVGMETVSFFLNFYR